MNKLTLVLATVSVLALAGCAPTSAPPPEEPSTGPDPVVVDSDHYKVEFENDRVRVLRITYGPGEKSVMHYHPGNVAVILTDQKGRFTLPDGSTEEAEAKTGDAVWGDGGQHLPENLGDEPFELILVELKEYEAEAGETSSTAPDATEADPGHYKVEFENDRVRVVRVTFGPNDKTALLYHPARVAVFLKDQKKVRFTRGDGSTEIGEAKAGEVVWADGGDLQVENLSGGPMELIMVELMK